MDARVMTFALLSTTLIHSSHQWTSHGSILFLSEGESTVLEAPGDSSLGCKWIFTHFDTGHSCCFASHSYFCDSAQCNNRCCERAGAEVNTEVDGVPGCTLALTELSESKDKGSYKVVFPANSDQGLEVSLWVYPAPAPVSQPAVNVDPQERRQKCWGWGECHPSVINREDFDCSMCPTADPSTWTADDVYFEVACEGDVGTLSFKLDDLLETNWLEPLTLELVYSTSNGGDVRMPVTAMPSPQEKYLAAQTRLCLSFDPGLSPTICGSCGLTPAPTVPTTAPTATKGPVVLITGGIVNDNRASSAEIYPPVSGCTLPSLPHARSEHAVFVTSEPNPKIALCGGYVSSGPTSSCLVLNVENQRWDENMIGQLTIDRRFHAVVSVENVGTYLIGGNSDNNPTTTDFLAHGLTEWTTGPNIPVSMATPCAVRISKLSFVAILNNDILEYQVDVANPTSSSGWQLPNPWPSLQTSRPFEPGCAVIDNKIVIAGGWSGSTYHKSSEVLDLSTRKITYGSDMKSPRAWFHLATAPLGGKIKLFAIGGYSGSSRLNSVEEFHPNSDSWSLSLTTIGEARNTFGAVVVPKDTVCPTTTTAGTSANSLLLTGGYDGNSRLPSTEILPSSSTIRCSPPPLPGERANHATFLTADDKPMVATCGGFDSGSLSSSCLVLDSSTGQWEENRIGSLLQGRSNHAAVTLEQFVYVIGGAPSSLSSTTELLRAGSSTWEQGPPLPLHMRYSPCAVAISSTSFLAIYEREIREFDISIAGPTSSKGWRDHWPKMERRRTNWPGCAKVGNKVIVAGGSDSSTTLQTTEILDLETRRISKGGNLVTARCFFHMITFDNNGDSTTLAVGGRGVGDSYLKTIEKWNPETETWSEEEDQLGEKKGFFGMVAAPKSQVCPSK